ncbi:MAG: hypothetical protein WC809_10930 [Sinimarinibacterium sp.]|jgi:hypothetical protein
MKKASKQRTVNGSAKTADPMQKTTPNPLAPPFTEADRKQDPRETAQEAVHQVTLKTSVDAPIPPSPAANAAKKAPLRAAKGDDDLMSKQPASPGC